MEKGGDTPVLSWGMVDGVSWGMVYMCPGASLTPGWIGYNVLDWFMRDMTTKELIIMADPNRPRHYEEEFKRRIVQS